MCSYKKIQNLVFEWDIFLENLRVRWGPMMPEPGEVQMGFTRTFPRNQDATVKLKTELISIKF